jgi:hypothetical protein
MFVHHRLPAIAKPKILDLVISDIPVIGNRWTVCGYCGESSFHSYACPIATEARRQERIDAYNLHHEYISFDEGDLA